MGVSGLPIGQAGPPRRLRPRVPAQAARTIMRLMVRLDLDPAQRSQVTIALLHRLWAVEAAARDHGDPDGSKAEQVAVMRGLLGTLMDQRPEDIPSA